MDDDMTLWQVPRVTQLTPSAPFKKSYLGPWVLSEFFQASVSQHQRTTPLPQQVVHHSYSKMLHSGLTYNSGTLHWPKPVI